MTNPSESRGKLWVAVAVVALAVLPYAPTLGHGFVHDDHMVLLDNRVVREERFLEAAVAPYHTRPGLATGLYRPLTTETFALNHALGGTHPRGYHALNVLLHAAVSLCVLEMAFAIGAGALAAGLGAALFAVHPVHVEAVSYVSGRADLLAALFVLLALLGWMRSTPGGRILAGGAFFGALLSKESAVAFPLVALAWELSGRPGAPSSAERPRASRAVSAGALIAPMVLYLLLRHHALGGLNVAPGAVTFIENPAVGQGLLIREATAVSAIARAAVLLVLPLRLSPDYSYAAIVPVTSPLTPSFVAGVGILALLGGALAFYLPRARPKSFLILFIVATYSIVSNLFLPIGTLLAERLLYLPSVGACVLAGSALAWGARRLSWPAGPGVVGLVLGAATLRTVTWSAVWHDDFSLFAAAFRTAPKSVKVLGNYAVALAFRGNLEEARRLLTDALVLAPEVASNRFNLAKVLSRLDDWSGAEREIRAVLEAEPDDGLAWEHLGVVLQRRSDLPGAERAFRRATELEPLARDARLGLAWIALERDDLPAAQQDLLDALAIDPGSTGALHGLGVVALRRGQWEEALGWLEKAARGSPPDVLLLTHLGHALEGMGRSQQAAEVYRRVLAAEPQHREARDALSRLTPTGPPGATRPQDDGTPPGGSPRRGGARRSPRARGERVPHPRDRERPSGGSSSEFSGDGRSTRRDSREGVAPRRRETRMGRAASTR